MNEVLSVATSFPTVVLSIALLVAVTYWTVAILGGLGMDSMDAADGVGDGDGFLDGLASTLRLEGVPLPLTLSLWAALAWFVSFVLSRLVSPLVDGAVGIGVGVLILVGSLVAGFFPVMALARPLRRFFRDTPATSRTDLVGRVAVVATGTVTSVFGQAEIRVESSAPVLVQVRCDETPSPSRGQNVLIVEYSDDRDAFVVVPADAALLP